MSAYEGTLARQLELGGGEGWVEPRQGLRHRGLRLAALPSRLRGPDKFRILEHRRRQAQIAARRLLDLEG